jgi:pyruvate dehydrogenase E2 component (dihydrolipoamide acetyltransferase)
VSAGSIDIVVPQVGEATSEVTLVRWLKEEGEAVAEGEPLFEVDTDKYVVEVEAFETGTLIEIVVPAGTEVVPLQVVARLSPEGGTVPGRARVDGGEGAERVSPRTPRAATPEPAVRVLASPKARRLAAELGIDLARLAGRGSGPDGLVTAEDVERTTPVLPAVPPSRLEPIPLSRRRRAIAEHMLESKRGVPHFYLLADVDMSEVQGLRSSCLTQLGWSRPPSITEFVVAASARALAAFPAVNVSYTEPGLIRRRQANVGIAVAVEEGLLVPVVHGADRLDLAELSERTRELAVRAREGRLREADVGDRSIVVSNLGMEGVDAFIAIIDVPDPMILAVGRVTDRCVAVDGAPAVRPMCTLTLSVDHRVLDGIPAARFLAAVRERLETPRDLLGSSR